MSSWLRFFYHYKEEVYPQRTLISIIHIRKTSHSSMSNISQTWLILLETSRPKARSLGMKPKVCCRPIATITREVYSSTVLYFIYLLPSYVFCHGHVSFGLNVIDHTLLQYHDQILYEPHS